MTGHVNRDEETPAPDADTTVITLRTPTSASLLSGISAFSPTRVAPMSDASGDNATLPYGPTEACGIVGIAAPHNVPSRVLTVLRGLQHRGQEGGGIVTHDGARVQRHRGNGLITDMETMNKLSLKRYVDVMDQFRVDYYVQLLDEHLEIPAEIVLYQSPTLPRGVYAGTRINILDYGAFPDKTARFLPRDD